MATLETLQRTVNKWADEITSRKFRLSTLRAEIDSLVTDSIDAKSESAKLAARVKRSEALVEAELVEAELLEVVNRWQVAQEAVKQFTINAAQEVYAKADAEARAKRDVMKLAFEKRLRFMNRGGRHGQSESSIKEKQKIEVDIANAQAEATIANKRAAVAGSELQAAREGV